MQLRTVFQRLTMMAASCVVLSSTVLADGISQDRLDAIAIDMQARVDEGRLSGAVIMVAKDGEIQMNEAFGHRDVGNGKPMMTNTIFRIFSMTKPVAGTALMQLYDQGKFELDDPVEKYIPEYAGMEVFVSENADGSFETEPADHAMTIRELMSHTGGLVYTPGLSSGPIADAYAKAGILDRDIALRDMMPKLAEIPLNHQPGSQWVYSISVDVQGYLVEVLSGQAFDEYLQQHIFAPLGMVDTAFHVAQEDANRFARQYRPSDEDGLTASDTGAFLQEPAFFSGGGGLTSTAADYMKFAQMHLNGGTTLHGTRILSEEAVELMRSNHLPTGVEGIGPLYPGNAFGLDFAVVTDSEAFDGASEGTHWWWGIAGSWFWIDPVENLIFIGMIQNDDIFYSIQTHSRSRQLIYQPL